MMTFVRAVAISLAISGASLVWGAGVAVAQPLASGATAPLCGGIPDIAAVAPVLAVPIGAPQKAAC